MLTFLISLGELVGYVPYRSNRCKQTGKHRHKSDGAAQAHIRSLERRGIKKGRVKEYRCEHCGDFHIGH